MAAVVNGNNNSRCIHNFAFVGFTAYGKFGAEHGNATFSFKAASIKTLTAVDKVLMADGGTYIAIAFDKCLRLNGLIEKNHNATIENTAPEKIRQLCANELYVLMLLENGKVYKYLPKFNEKFSEIKFELSETHKKLQKRDIFGRPKVEQKEQTVKITHIALGDHIAVAISSTYEVFNIPSKIYEFPFKIPVKALECGAEHALLLNANGDLYSWGIGLRGQLGHGCPGNWEHPKLINALAGVKIKSIAAAGWHSAAISVFDDVYIWGFNSNGQIAQIIQNRQSVYTLPQLIDLPICKCGVTKIETETETETDVSTETKTNALEIVNSLTECVPVDVKAGYRHTILRMSCGSLYGCGWNAFGQLGFYSNCDENSDAASDSVNNIDQFKKINLNDLNFETVDAEIVCGRWNTILIPK